MCLLFINISFFPSFLCLFHETKPICLINIIWEYFIFFSKYFENIELLVSCLKMK